MSRSGAIAALGICVALAVGCSTPVGVSRANPRSVQRELTRSVISNGQLSRTTANMLYRWDLTQQFEKDPEGAIAVLHAAVVDGRAGRGVVCALAELSFRHAEQSGKRPYYLAAVVYAYAFLFPDDPADRVDAFDPRLRLATDLYNLGITKAFASKGGDVELAGGSFELPFGVLAVSFDPASLKWGSRTLAHFTPVAELEVHGLPTRYRRPGIGAPLAAGTLPLDPAQGFDDFVEPWAKVPVTALLRFDGLRHQVARGVVQGRLELLAASTGDTTEIEGRKVPLEVETTASLAYTLAESPLWEQEIAGFLQGAGVIDQKSRLAAFTPYRPGRMPIVLVHGTASSAARWAQMVNELSNDRQLRDHYQFWLFSYDTGNPIAYSAMLLREALRDALTKLDPEDRDPALRQMVVIGHSQGGLLTKMTAVESGDRFWQNLSKKPFDQVDLSAKTRGLLQRTVFVHPLPFVKRVIFIATPQHGSYFSGNRISHLIARFITFPLDVVRVANDLILRSDQAAAFVTLKRMPTAVDNMTPGNPFIVALASLPVTPGVKAHSIIAVKGNGPIEDGDDGIVEYKSAHIEPVDSEFVVRSAHSCQDNPHTIAEVRRILLEQLKAE